MEPFLLGPWAGARFRAIQKCALPSCRSFTADQWDESFRIVNHLLGGKAPGVRRQLRAFLVVIEGLSFVTGGTGFPDLDPERQTRVLALLFDAPVPLLRKGFWGLNTLVKLSVFGQPSVYSAIHYQRKGLPHA